MINVDYRLDYYEYALKRCLKEGLKADAKRYYFLIKNLLML